MVLRSALKDLTCSSLSSSFDAETRNRFQENACPNTCDELGAAERIEAERLAKLAEEGLQIKADLIQRGKDLK